MDLRLLHFADSHLRDCDLDEIRSCLSFVARQARAEKPDLIVCAGDVFDSQHVRLDSLSAKTAFEIFSELADIAPVAVVGGTPSHEGTATEVFRHISARNDIHVSIVAEQLVLWDKHLFPLSEVDPYGVPPNIAVISMVPAFTKQFLKTGSDVHTSDAEAAAMVANLLAGFGAVASAWDCPHILVGHFPVGGALVSSTQMLTGVDVEVSRDMLALADADLICLGHIHKAQRVGEKAFYSGSTQSCNWGELDEKGFWIHTIGNPSVESRFVLTPGRKRIRVSQDYTAENALRFGFVDQDIVPHADGDCRGAHVRFEAKVYVDEADKFDREIIRNHYLSDGAESCDVILIRVPRLQPRSSQLVKLERLRERLVERAVLMSDTVSESILEKADLLEVDTELAAKIAAR